MKKVLFILICMCILLSGCQNNTAGTANTYESVAGINEEAVKFYDSDDFSTALIKYSEAVSSNPTDMDAMIGMAQCQIAVGNYSMADINLSAAVRIDPTDHRIYDLYLHMSEESDNLDYARTAVSLARAYDITDFLEKIPETPEISCPDGLYDSKIDVEIAASDGADIFVTESKGSMQTSYEYHEPITITHGDTSLEVYCVVDGIPSDIVNAKYVCDYPPMEVSFTDPVIEQLVRQNLGIVSGAITDVDCESVTAIWQNTLRIGGMPWDEYEKNYVSSLEDMRLFPNLQQLELDNLGNITDFSALASCKYLIDLNFSDCNIQDISFVKYLPNMQACMLSDNKITDLSPLVQCENLIDLYVDGNPISGLEVLEDLDLRYITVSATSISDFSIFSHWKNLRFLQMFGCGGVDLSLLGDLSKLEDLYLQAWDVSNNNIGSRQTPISDISFLTGLTGLEHLGIIGLSNYDQVDTIKTLSHLIEVDIQAFDDSSLPDNIRQELQTALPKCVIK